MNEIQLDWQALHVLLVVAKAGSLSKAAEQMGVSQPTVSRRIQGLEAELGGPLLQRTVQGCHLTPRGQALLPMLEHMSRASEGIERLARFEHEDATGEVRVATGEQIGRLLARNSVSLLVGMPDVQLNILVGMKNVNLERGDAHIAFRAKKPESGNLFARRVSSSTFGVFAAPSFLEQYPEALDERKFTHCRWATFVPELQHLRSAKWLRTRIGPNTPLLCFNTSTLIIDAVAGGAAIAVLPGYAGDHEPGIQQIGEPIEALTFSSWMVLHRDTRQLPHVRIVAERISQLLASTLPLR